MGIPTHRVRGQRYPPDAAAFCLGNGEFNYQRTDIATNAGRSSLRAW
jgi:hypothetical protein